ncbi:MAG: COG1470 family protein [Vulcanimicrobiaceae bacterium]
MKHLFKGCFAGCGLLLALLVLAGPLLVIVWFAVRIIRMILRLLQQRGSVLGQLQPGTADLNCQVVPPWINRQPDPFIYDQRWLMSLGLAVTWENPDVRIEKGGVPVDSSDLQPDSDYDVIARIWNNSVDAPVQFLPVYYSYLEFGIATQRIPIGTTHADLGVKGSPTCPAYATYTWHTPAAAGHYCLLIELLWSDDKNPYNNLGQHNTNVKALNSPHASFTFPVRNPAQVEQEIELRLDAYQLPNLQDCIAQQPAADPKLTRDEISRQYQIARAIHNPKKFPIPGGWSVEAQPDRLRLGPGEQQDVTVEITAPDGFAGRQAINVNGFAGRTLIGGVTLYVKA